MGYPTSYRKRAAASHADPVPRKAPNSRPVPPRPLRRNPLPIRPLPEVPNYGSAGLTFTRNEAKVVFGRRNVARTIARSGLRHLLGFTDVAEGVAWLISPTPAKGIALTGWRLYDGFYAQRPGESGPVWRPGSFDFAKGVQLGGQAIGTPQPGDMVSLEPGVGTTLPSTNRTQAMLFWANNGLCPTCWRGAEHSTWLRDTYRVGDPVQAVAYRVAAPREVEFTFPGRATLPLPGRLIVPVPPPLYRSRSYSPNPEASRGAEPSNRPEPSGWATHNPSLVVELTPGHGTGLNPRPSPGAASSPTPSQPIQPYRPGVREEPGTHRPTRPGRRMKETKVRARNAFVIAMWKAIGQFTEALDASECLHRALPKKTQRRLFKERGFRAPTPSEKASEIYANWEHVDQNNALTCILQSNFEDRVWAALKTKGGHGNGPVGLQTGPWDDMPWLKELDIKYEKPEWYERFWQKVEEIIRTYDEMEGK